MIPGLRRTVIAIAITGATAAWAEEAPKRESAARALPTAEIQAAAQRIDAARRSMPSGSSDPFELLAQELRAIRSLLGELAAPHARRMPEDPAPSLTHRAAELRRRCRGLRPAIAQRPALGDLVSRLEDRCDRLLGAIDEIFALPGAAERSERALALLGELAGAGPKGHDPRRAQHQPTISGPQ